MVKVKKSLDGMRFGRLKVIKQCKDYVTPKGRHSSKYLCKCDCGNETEVMANSLKMGLSKSCSCLQKEKAKQQTKHGLVNHPLYVKWHNMIQRCENTKDVAYKNYGGRDIKVCKDWHDARIFLKWALPKYKKGLQIDRIDNNGNYEPSNCRFVTSSENIINQRKRKDNTSGYTGVYWGKSRSKWEVEITYQNKKHHLGLYNTKKIALEVRNNWIIENKTSHTIQEWRGKNG